MCIRDRACAEKNEIYKGLLDEMSPDDLSAEVKDTLDGLRAMGKMCIRDRFWCVRFPLSRLPSTIKRKSIRREDL